MVDVLSNNLSVKLFNRQREEQRYLDQTFQDTTRAEQNLEWTYFWMWLVFGYSISVVLILNLYFLLKGRQEGWITVGDFALVLTININMVDFLWEIMREFSKFSKLFGRIKQALETILTPVDLKDVPNARELVLLNGGEGGSEITFENVRFHYKGSEPLFENKSITIKRGEKVGLVGYSGSGKSTFVNLILRLFDVSSGRILIDGQDIKTVTQSSLRLAIGMIPQDPTLFHRTLLENIAYGREGVSPDEVMVAAQKAHAHDFIIKLPLGYASEVGERGVKLSGGQRQRIAIARAILKDAPILILDEATSQLDSLTEQMIQESLWNLMKGKTTLVVAHRLSTLLQMDRILVFDKGKIIEDGPHQELLAKEGLYKNLWDAQVGGFLGDAKREDEA
jgi:ATP-binding cassette subfamily B protein